LPMRWASSTTRGVTAHTPRQHVERATVRVASMAGRWDMISKRSEFAADVVLTIVRGRWGEGSRGGTHTDVVVGGGEGEVVIVVIEVTVSLRRRDGGGRR
jgi:hypothetical protein